MDDRQLEIIIGNLLRAGVLLAAAVVFAGGVLYLAQHHADKVDYRTLSPGMRRACATLPVSCIQLST